MFELQAEVLILTCVVHVICVINGMPGRDIWEAYILPYFVYRQFEVHMIHTVNLPGNIILVVEIISSFLVL
jgi:hypothetical protein